MVQDPWFWENVTDSNSWWCYCCIITSFASQCGCLVLWSSAICPRLLLGRDFQLTWLYSPFQILFSDHRSPLHSLRLLCFVSRPQRHLAVTSCPRASLVGTLHGSRVYILASQVPPTSLPATFSPPGTSFACFSFKGLLTSCFSLVYISTENKDPRTLLRESPKGR